MKIIKIMQNNNIDAVKYLMLEINQTINENINLINNIATNGNLASILQDSLFYTLNFKDSKTDENGKKQQFFPIGNICNLPLNVDTLQSWDNNKIHLKKDNEIIFTVEVKDENNILI